MKGASTGDLSSIWACSTRTIHNVLKPLVESRTEIAFKGKIVKSSEKFGYRQFLSGVRRLSKYNGRVDLKVKLGAKASIAKAWFRYVLLSGFNDLEQALKSIESGEKPP